ncbi:MAG: crossover junction endodeoxyribonuclease RuvC [Candidatus Pacebacteria bacterium]|nr:crossover junction endodeoxyribonuclease RuvC [Candidatus Paceibacterota bacterium]
MIILGIDPGTATTGYGVLESIGGNLKMVENGCILTDKGLEMPERLNILGKEIRVLVKKFRPDAMAIEELFYFKNKKTVISVGQARGVAVFVGENEGVEMHEYTPLQVKQAVTGYGRADKKQVQSMVKNILKLKEVPKPDDAADALAVAICCASSINFEKKTKLKCA